MSRLYCPRESEGCRGYLVLDPEDDVLVCNQCSRRFLKDGKTPVTAPGVIWNEKEPDNMAQLQLSVPPSRSGGATVLHQYYEDNKDAIISDYNKLIAVYGEKEGTNRLLKHWDMGRATWKLKAEKRKVFRQGFFVTWGLQKIGEVVTEKPRKVKPEKPVPMLFAGIEKTGDGKFSFICTTKERVKLYPGINYRVVLSDVNFDQNITINIGRLGKNESD